MPAERAAVPETLTSTSGSPDHVHWQRNLWVCACGSFATIVAMTLLIPFLPVYVRELGVSSSDAVLRWSGIAYAATFFTAALTAPLWGALGDRFGRKSMLIRASLGMAIAMSLIGLAQTVWQLVALRLLVGLLGGYSSAATILVAAQAPRERSAWALGVLSSGIMAGGVAGPLLGGVLPQAVGIRQTFLLTGALVFCAFIATAALLEGDRPTPTARTTRGHTSSDTRPTGSSGAGSTVAVLLVTASMLMFATMSIEPLVTEYVTELNGAEGATMWSGLVMSLGALGSIVSAPLVGRLADRVGHTRVIVGCLVAAAVCLIAQGCASDVEQLAAARLAMGLALGGLMPTVTAAIRRAAPSHRIGRTLGLGVSAQYAGQVLGPITGGVVAGATGMRTVFIGTAGVLLGAAVVNLVATRALSRSDVAQGP